MNRLVRLKVQVLIGLAVGAIGSLTTGGALALRMSYETRCETIPGGTVIYPGGSYTYPSYMECTVLYGGTNDSKYYDGYYDGVVFGGGGGGSGSGDGVWINVPAGSETVQVNLIKNQVKATFMTCGDEMDVKQRNVQAILSKNAFISSTTVVMLIVSDGKQAFTRTGPPRSSFQFVAIGPCSS